VTCPSIPVPVEKEGGLDPAIASMMSAVRKLRTPLRNALQCPKTASMINARCETAASKPAFRDALKSRRCLIPADGFYEWVRAGKTKQPYCFEVNDGELKPYDARLVRSFPLSTKINHLANDDEECSRPVELAAIQDRLFA
jgi:hypothetical protein